MNRDFETFYTNIYKDKYIDLINRLQNRTNQHCTVARHDDGSTYDVDAASIVVVGFILEVLKNRNSNIYSILDACAAPGGKSLTLAHLWPEHLSTSAYELTCNELSPQRRQRLQYNLGHFLENAKQPPQSLQCTAHDASLLFKFFENTFDHILLDAPCSSERHVLQSPTHLTEWKPSRPKQLAQRQYSLLCSAYECLKEEAVLTYSTCSINPGENDGVIKKFLTRAEKKNLSARLLKPDIENHALMAIFQRYLPAGIYDLISHDNYYTTEFGLQLMPTPQLNWGPMYVAQIKKGL